MAFIRSNFFIIFSIIHLVLVGLSIAFLGQGYKGDTGFYIEIAKGFSNFNFFDPLLNWKFGPAYPFFLLIFGGFIDYNIYWIAIIQALLFIIAAYKMSNALFKDNAYKPFSIMMLFPSFILTNSTLMSESLCGTLILATIYLVFYSRNIYRDKLASLVVGCLIMIRFEMLVFVFVIFMVALIKRQLSSYRQAIVWLSIPILFIGLNSWKNLMTYDVLTPTSFGGGTVIYGGNNAGLDGSWHPHSLYKGYISEDREEEYLYLTEEKDFKTSVQKQDALYKEMALSSWRSNFSDHILLIPVKWLRTWLLPAELDIFTMTPVSQNRGLRILDHFGDQFSFLGKLKHAIYILFHWLGLIIIAFGFIRLRKFSKTNIAHEFILLNSFYIFIAASILYSIIFYGLPRFNAAIMPLLVLVGSFAFSPLINRRLD